MRRNTQAQQQKLTARETRRLIQAGMPPRGGGQRDEHDGDVSGSVSGAAVTAYGRLDWTDLTETAGDDGGFVLG